MAPLDGLVVLQVLRRSIAKRQTNLLSLSVTLVVNEKSKEEVEEILDTVLTPYKTGLTKAKDIHTMTVVPDQDALTSFGQRLNIAVVGANGRIGAAIAGLLATNPNVSKVFRLMRDPYYSGASETRILLDLENEKTIRDAAAAVACAAESLHLVIVATGVLHDGQSLQPEKSWNALTDSALERAFRINATGPALVAKHFLPLLAVNRKTAFAALSARVGSIQENRLGGWYAYRASKAALNMLIKSLSIELARKRPRALCIGLHPGTVDTPLSEPFQRNVPEGALFTPNQAAEYFLRALDSLKPEDTGNQFAWDGCQIPA